ncbi:MAG TPA: tetratricopeptide repeat protein [Arenimonas sp.]|nr:tetratricopeptide repeat protein [Arenimonas sp.]
MSEQYDEHEQSERVKQWLLKNGSNILTVILLAIASVGAWQWWQGKQASNSMEAANQYQVFVQAIEKNDKAKATVLGEAVIANYAKSDFAFLAALRLAKFHMSQGKPELALTVLEKANTVANSDSNRELANIRIVQLHLTQGKLAQADAKLNTFKPEYFPAGYAEIQGDLALAKGKRTEAAAFYQTALNKLTATAGSRGLIEIKLSEAGGTNSGTQSEIR